MKFTDRLTAPVLAGVAVALLAATQGSAATRAVAQRAGLLRGEQIAADSIPGDRVKARSLTGRQIAGRSVPGFKLAPDSVAADRLKRASIGRRELAAGAVDGARVAPDSLGGGQVDERALGPVPRADAADRATDADTVGGVPASELTIARTGTAPACDPAGPSFVSCAVATIVAPRPARLQIAASAEWHLDAPPPGRGTCRIELDGSPIAGTERRPGLASSATDALHNLSLATGATTAPIGAGQHDVALACNQLEGDIAFANLSASALLVGER